MAKKKPIKGQAKTTKTEIQENSLPQNILLMGEHVEEDKNIYILQSVYNTIHKFTQNKTTNESGGMLIGSVIEEFGKTNIVISGFVEAKYCEATPTTLTFTHRTWEYCHKEIDRKYSGKKIVGWIPILTSVFSCRNMTSSFMRTFLAKSIRSHMWLIRFRKLKDSISG